MNELVASTVSSGQVDTGFTYFVWAIAVTALFHAVQDFRKNEKIWGYIYSSISVLFWLLGFLWPLLPVAVSAVISARSDQIFIAGTFIYAIIYCLIRRSWVVRGDRRLIVGFTEGVAVFVFLTLILSPLLPDRTVVEIFVNTRQIFVLGGLSGIFLVVTETLRGEIADPLRASSE